MTNKEALDILSLNYIPNPVGLKLAYRAASKLAHPDAGGSVEMFSNVQKAYAHLQRPTTSLDAVMDMIGNVQGEPKKRLEKHFQKQVMTLLRATDHVVFNVHGHEMQASGWPDLYVAGTFTGWIEIKGLRTKVQPLQEEVMLRLRNRGVPAFVLRDGWELSIPGLKRCIEVNDYTKAEDLLRGLLKFSAMIPLGKGLHGKYESLKP